MKRKGTATNFDVKRTRIEQEKNRRGATKNPAIVEINCGDYLSLYCAVLVGVFYYENGGGKWEPAERHARSSRLTDAARVLWNLFGGAPEQTSLKDVKKVYKHLEETFPEMYRILVFTDTSATHTVYNSGNNAKYTICLYYHDGCFDLIKTPQKFFRKKHYCVDCEKTYENQADHTKCNIRCRQCFRIGYGYQCKGELDLECQDCHKIFPTMDCMLAHKPYSCSTYHRCIYCNVVYRVRPERPCNGHQCAKAPATPSIASEAAIVPRILGQDGPSCAATACTWPGHHGGVQQDILSWLVK